MPKEVRKHQETIFFGLSARQFFCSVIAVGLSVLVYLCLSSKIGKETAGWLCILAASPVAVAGFFHFNGMTLEQFLWAAIKSQILCAKPRRFVSENFYYVCLGRKERDDFD
nr:PrgI family protein [Flavonifractor sp. An52]